MGLSIRFINQYDKYNQKYFNDTFAILLSDLAETYSIFYNFSIIKNNSSIELEEVLNVLGIKNYERFKIFLKMLSLFKLVNVGVDKNNENVWYIKFLPLPDFDSFFINNFKKMLLMAVGDERMEELVTLYSQTEKTNSIWKQTELMNDLGFNNYNTLDFDVIVAFLNRITSSTIILSNLHKNTINSFYLTFDFNHEEIKNALEHSLEKIKSDFFINNTKLYTELAKIAKIKNINAKLPQKIIISRNIDELIINKSYMEAKDDDKFQNYINYSSYEFYNDLVNDELDDEQLMFINSISEYGLCSVVINIIFDYTTLVIGSAATSRFIIYAKKILETAKIKKLNSAEKIWTHLNTAFMRRQENSIKSQTSGGFNNHNFEQKQQFNSFNKEKKGFKIKNDL
ncbi:MAG: hypothetical protein LBH55_03310 [Mycoplasmataceae bacterium]|nr:hypothetical protein [Mycoplasmataceae bacterium]